MCGERAGCWPHRVFPAAPPPFQQTPRPHPTLGRSLVFAGSAFFLIHHTVQRSDPRRFCENMRHGTAVIPLVETLMSTNGSGRRRTGSESPINGRPEVVSWDRVFCKINKAFVPPRRDHWRMIDGRAACTARTSLPGRQNLTNPGADYPELPLVIRRRVGGSALILKHPECHSTDYSETSAECRADVSRRRPGIQPTSRIRWEITWDLTVTRQSASEIIQSSLIHRHYQMLYWYTGPTFWPHINIIAYKL